MYTIFNKFLHLCLYFSVNAVRGCVTKAAKVSFSTLECIVAT